jgi:hypothetical protein
MSAFDRLKASLGGVGNPLNFTLKVEPRSAIAGVSPQEAFTAVADWVESRKALITDRSAPRILAFTVSESSLMNLNLATKINCQASFEPTEGGTLVTLATSVPPGPVLVTTGPVMIRQRQSKLMDEFFARIERLVPGSIGVAATNTGVPRGTESEPPEVTELAELRNAGILTEEEFERKRAELIARGSG